MYFKATEYDAKEVYKFVRQATNKTHEELAKDLNKSVDWSKSNEIGRSNYLFKDMLAICKKNNIEIIFKEKNHKLKK